MSPWYVYVFAKNDIQQLSKNGSRFWGPLWGGVVVPPQRHPKPAPLKRSSMVLRVYHPLEPLSPQTAYLKHFEVVLRFLLPPFPRVRFFATNPNTLNLGIKGSLRSDSGQETRKRVSRALSHPLPLDTFRVLSVACKKQPLSWTRLKRALICSVIDFIP